MKFGNIEGTPEEISDFIENNGLQLSDYIEKPEQSRPGTGWFIASIAAYGVTLLGVFFLESRAPEVASLLSLLCFGFAIWATVCIQIKYENAWASGFAALGMVLLVLLANGAITMTEVAEQMSEFQQE